MVDPHKITTAGTKLAFALAANCNDDEAMDQINRDALIESGSSGFGYVAVCALRVMVEHILGPVLEAAEAAGVEMRSGLQDMADGIDPITGLAL